MYYGTINKTFSLNEEAKEILLSSQENACINLFSLDKNVAIDFNERTSPEYFDTSDIWHRLILRG
ncbi:hypothetical protein J4731_07225 [Providencia rettgeri]|nr:hypothetical protein [Providencia rettgeri]